MSGTLPSTNLNCIAVLALESIMAYMRYVEIEECDLSWRLIK